MIHVNSGKRGRALRWHARGRFHGEGSYRLGGIELEGRGGIIVAHHWGYQINQVGAEIGSL